MPPVSTLLMPFAQQIADEAAARIVDHNNAPLKTYPREPGMAGLTRLPALVVGWGQVARTPPETAESELGSVDVTLTYPVLIYHDLRELEAATERVYPLVEQYIDMIDDHPTWLTVLDAKCTSARPFEVVADDTSRPLVAYECLTELRVLQPQ